MKFDYHPLVEVDIREAATFYEERLPGLSIEIKQAFQAAVQRISVNPLRWRKFHDSYRRCNLKRFPYYIVFKINGHDSIRVLALVHTRRHPDYWVSRKEIG